MPLYEYRCGSGHVREELRAYEDRDEPLECACGEQAARIPSAHHQPPDGIYSYAPNIGTVAEFERKKVDADARADRLGTYKP